MNRLQSLFSDLFWDLTVVILACAWTLGIQLGQACGILEDHEKIIPTGKNTGDLSENNTAMRLLPPSGQSSYVPGEMSSSGRAQRLSKDSGASEVASRSAR
jgi:hypothetical protein